MASLRVPAVLVVLVVVVAMVYFSIKPPAPVTARTITVDGVSVAVDVADTAGLREQGLSGRSDLRSGQGMLFIFDTDGIWGIWMKDMNFPIDILWADASGTVITIAADVAPDTYPEVFNPSAPARYVVELPAGFAAAHGIAEGTKIVL